MKKLFFLIGLVICVSCAASQEESSIVMNKTETQTVLFSLANTGTTIRTPSLTKFFTPTKEQISTLNPTEEYENSRAERYNFYFRDQCKGYMGIENISLDLNWGLCTTTESIILLNYESQGWEIPISNNYQDNFDEQKIAPILWSMDGKIVYIEFYLGDDPLQIGRTIAIWRINLDDGKKKEILVSKTMRGYGRYYAYTSSISPNGRRLAYTTYEGDISLNIIDLFTEEIISFSMGHGYAYENLYWSPDESKLAFAMVKEKNIPEVYTNDIYLIEFPQKIKRLILRNSNNDYNFDYHIENITNDYVVFTDGNNRYEYNIATEIFSLLPKN